MQPGQGVGLGVWGFGVWKACAIAMLLVAPAVAATPAGAVALARDDVLRQTPALRPYLRYLSLHGLPAAERARAAKVLSFHVNSLSTEAEIVPPAPVGDGSLLRINLIDYGWSRKTWEKLADVEPYFHVRLEKDQEYGHYDQYGQWVTTETRKEKVTATAPWIAETPQQQAIIKGLIEVTQSQVPIVKADWFFAQTAIQADRDGTGYYDFLGLGKKQADFDTLVGFDAKLAARFKAEINGVVLRSTVALNNRRLVRFGKIGGAKWITLDAKNGLDRRNFARVLDEGFEFDATEQIASLPNGLHAFWLANARGERQDTAPDFIASDGSASGTDRRVHASKSCVVCHVEGIRPIDDWVRRLVKPPLALQSPDYEKLKRLRQLYLSDLDGSVKRDNEQYAAAVLRCNGLTLAANARAYRTFWDRYVEEDFGPERVAAEVGITKEQLLAGLGAYTKKTGSVDPILAGLLQTPPLPIRSDQFEEAYPLLQTAIRGYVPVGGR